MFEILRRLIDIRESITLLRNLAGREMVDVNYNVPELKQMEELAFRAQQSVESYYAPDPE